MPEVHMPWLQRWLQQYNLLWWGELIIARYNNTKQQPFRLTGITLSPYVHVHYSKQNCKQARALARVALLASSLKLECMSQS